MHWQRRLRPGSLHGVVQLQAHPLQVLDQQVIHKQFEPRSDRDGLDRWEAWTADHAQEGERENELKWDLHKIRFIFFAPCAEVS